MANRHTASLSSILATYPMGGPVLLMALEQYCQTVFDLGKRDGIDDEAARYCDQLHDSPPKGLACKQCYDAVQNLKSLIQVEAEIAISHQNK